MQEGGCTELCAKTKAAIYVREGGDLQMRRRRSTYEKVAIYGQTKWLLGLLSESKTLYISLERCLRGQCSVQVQHFTDMFKQKRFLAQNFRQGPDKQVHYPTFLFVTI